ncbi:hypothetical protein E1267_39850 [Nonomuraea longispora]|uniref:Uncharacterized protein n=1 Tax=Nonomuraea longispora TaxID=1848320 RepID=A0A4V2XI62_9ACTN|nr:hypothetical protein [Nonomuraea longispora]TDB97425.1 hypothetical protein E1267_39850 [Nonomuraea longispora]
MAALVVLALFMVLVCGIRAADRHKDPYQGPRTEVEHMTRSVLMYARRKDRPQQAAPDPDRARGGDQR